LALNFTGSSLPTPLERSIGLLGDAAIPAMLVVLGLRLSRASIRGQIKPVLIVSAIKLMVAPVVGLLLAMLLGLSGLTRQVGITQSSMPTAVMASILATEFGSESEVVTGTIVVTTLASMVTLSILLSLLM
jgi:predicted permease